MFKIYTALITPFNDDLSIDYHAIDKLMSQLISLGNNHFVLCGTTGEASCLSVQEKKDLVSYITTTYPDCHYVVGISTNCTKEALRQIEELSFIENIEAMMVVVPYYNKPSQEGLYQHFHCIASKCSKDIILYNIPGRSVVSLETKTIMRLIKDHKNIVGLKQAGDISDSEYIKQRYPNFSIYLGSDELLEEALNIGLDGVVSVSSHILYNDIVKASNSVSFDFDKYTQLCKLLFVEASPAPVKYLLSKKGLIQNKLRLPLVSIGDNTKEILDNYYSN